jgi:hypothetical protein
MNLFLAAKFSQDMYDQYRSYVKLDLRSRKYWHPLFWLIIESALVNAWLLYKTSREAAKLQLEYTLFTFRKSIALALVSEWEASGCRLASSFESPTKKMQSARTPRYHLKKLDDSEGTRFTSKDNHFTFLSQLPLPPNSKLKKRQMQCRLCRTRRTVYWCKNCEVPLCRAPCFLQYHSKPDGKQTDMVAKQGENNDLFPESPKRL